MGFTKKTWKNRIAEYINRRLITMEDGSTSLVTVARDEGTISQEGDAFNAANMNDLEDRIESEFNEINKSLNSLPIELSYLYSTSESGSEKKQLVKSISEFKEIMLVARKHESNFYSAPNIRVPRDKCVQNTILRTQDFDGNWIQVNFIDDTHIMWSFDNSAKPQFQILGELYGI